MSKQQLPPPASEDKLRAAIGRVVSPSVPATRAQPSAPSAPLMDKRSWYMRRVTADRLDELVTDLHFATRLPRHVVLAAMVEVMAANLEQVRDRLDRETP
jgi:hypothetical protein